MMRGAEPLVAILAFRLVRWNKPHAADHVD
jgi:hypothetical protein